MLNSKGTILRKKFYNRFVMQDQNAANSLRRQVSDLSCKISADIRPVYTSRKIKDEIKMKEKEPPMVN